MGTIMHVRWTGHLKRHIRNCLRFLLGAVLSCSLVMMCTVLLLDDTGALLSDSNLQAVAEAGDWPDDDNLQDDDDDVGVMSIVHGIRTRGNGDQDDNKEEGFSLCRLARQSILFKTQPALNSFMERRTARSYKDFGHLKAMPAGDDLAGIYNQSLLT